MIDVLERIAAQRAIPVVRSGNAEDAVQTARACRAAGMNVIELTRTIPDLERALEVLRADELVLGVGTITDAVQVEAAAQGGARFAVSFANPPEMVSAARGLGLAAIPGALTPTEVLHCVAEGADAVKIFPARALSPAYLRDLRLLMPGLRTLVTGGLRISAESIRPWLDAGATAVGLGSDLGTAADCGVAEVQRRAGEALELVVRSVA